MRSLPESITTERQIPGYHNPLWLPRSLRPEENISVQQALAEIETRLTPAPKAVIAVHLGRLMNTCGTEQKLSPGEVEAKLNEYAHHLAEFSESNLKLAISEYVRTEKWFPKISELRELLVKGRSRADVMRRRARILLGLEEASDWEKSLVQKLEDDRARRAMEATGPTPETKSKLAESIAALPPALAESVQRMMEGARQSHEQKREAAE